MSKTPPVVTSPHLCPRTGLAAGAAELQGQQRALGLQAASREPPGLGRFWLLCSATLHREMRNNLVQAFPSECYTWGPVADHCSLSLLAAV